MALPPEQPAFSSEPAATIRAARSSPCATRSARSSSARRARSRAWSPRCWCGATCCSRACPAWPRRCSSRRWPPRSTSTSKRVQFTPDLMPSDVIGQSIFEPRESTLPVPRGAGVHQPAAGRRDQPHAAQDPGGAARGHGGAPGLGRGRHPPAARPVHRGRHPEPGRVRGHLPAARGPARPLPVQAAGRLPDLRAGAGDAGPPRRRARPPRRDRRRGAAGGQRRRPGRGPGRDRAAPGRAAGAGLHRVAGAGHPRRRRRWRSACRPAAPPRCCTRPRRGPGWRDATS